jgi:hypothetical protein
MTHHQYHLIIVIIMMAPAPTTITPSTHLAPVIPEQRHQPVEDLSRLGGREEGHVLRVRHRQRRRRLHLHIPDKDKTRESLNI